MLGWQFFRIKLSEIAWFLISRSGNGCRGVDHDEFGSRERENGLTEPRCQGGHCSEMLGDKVWLGVRSRIFELRCVKSGEEI